MTNSPNSDNETERSANRRIWLLWLSRGGLGFGVLLLVGIAAGAWWAWVFVNRELAPQVERNLSQTFQRPVRVGKVESFGLNKLRFGRSEIPATATDSDRATAEAVDVTFNPLQLLFTRSLDLDVTLVNADAYIEQDNNNRWIATQIKPQAGTGPIQLQLKTIRLSNGRVVLLPNPKPGNSRIPVAIAPLSGSTEFLDNAKRLRVDLQGQFAQSPVPNPQSPIPNPQNNFKVSGEYQIPTQQANLQLQAQNLPVVEIDRLIKVPVDLKAGRVSGNLTARYNPKEQPFVLGTASFQEIALQTPQLPAPITNANGTVNFTGQGVNIDNLSTFLGQIPIQASGSLDLQKPINLNVNVPNVAISTVTQTFKINPPVPVSGEVRLTTNVTGTIQEPIVLGEVTTTKQTQVEKLNFNKIGTSFAFAPKTGELALSNIQIQPVVGGTITGKGNVKLGNQGGVVIDLQGQNLPADAIAQIYGANVPANIKIGNLSAQTQVFGPLNDIRVLTRFQAPEATYPVTGEVVIAGGETILRNTTVRIPGGTVQASARIANRRWQAEVQSSQLPFNSILAIAQSNSAEQKPQQSQIPLPIQQGRISGTARLTGSVDSFKLEDIQAIANANLQVAGGNVQIRQGQLNQGRWQASVNLSGIELSRFPQVPPQFRSTLNGQFQVAGNLTSPQASNIQLVGQGTLNVAGGTVQILQAALRDGAWEATVRANQVDLGQLAQVPPELRSPFSGQFLVAGNLDSPGGVGNIKAVGSGNLQVAGGRVNISQLDLNQGNFRATIAASGVQLGRFPQVPKELQAGAFSGQFQVAGNLNNLTNNSQQSPLSQIQAVGSGNLQVAGGNVRVRQLQLERGNFQALLDTSNIKLARFPQVPQQLQGTFSGQLQASGNLETLTAKDKSPLSEIQATARGNLQIAAGTVRLREVKLSRGNFQASLDANNVQLARFPQVPKQLQGTFSGQVEASGNLESLTAEDKSPLSEIQASAKGTLQIGAGVVQLRQLQLSGGNFQAVVDANNVQLAAFPQVPKQLQGTFSGQLEASGNLETLTAKDKSPLSEIQASAKGTLQIGAGVVQLRQLQLSGGNFQAVVDANNVQLAAFPQVPKQFQGTFSGQLEASGNLETLTAKDSLPLSEIQASATGNLQIAGGNLRLRQLQLERGNFQAQVDASNIQLSRLTQVPKQFQGGRFSGQLQAEGNIETLTATDPKKSPLSTIQASAEGNLQIDGGNVQIRQLQLNSGNWQVALDANRIQLANFPQVPPQFQGIFSGQLEASGNINAFTQKSGELPLSEIQGVGRGNLQLARGGGTVEIREAQIDRGRWAASVNLAQVQINRFSQQLQGRLNGDLKVGGSLAALTRKDSPILADIQAVGNLNFTQAPYLNRPLNVAFQWNGQQLQIQQATAPGLIASGVISARFDVNNRPDITDVNLNVQAEDLNLRTLPLNLPQNVTVAGLVDFNGQISGRPPNALNVTGDLQLQNLVVGNFKFDPVLKGTVQAIAQQGVSLELQGNQDQIALRLDQNYRPENFLFRRGETVATGSKQGDLFLVDVANFPVATLRDLARTFVNLPPEVAVQPVGGQLSGNFAIDFDTFAVVGNNVAIAKPRVGELDADALTANFRYANGTVEIISSELRKGESIYALSGSITQLGPNPQVQGKVQIQKGKIENVLAAVDWFNLQGFAGRRGRNYGTAANVQTVGVGIPERSLEAQLERFSEINALLQQQRTRRRRTFQIPDITELKGEFNGSIAFAGTLPTAIQANFDLSGENWQLGEYTANQVLAQGRYENGNLIVQALRIQSQDRLIAFNGILGQQQQNGQLEIQNFPVEVLNDILELPVYVTGKLNGTVNVSGNLENPQATGQFTLAQGTLNQTQIQSAQADFNYVNSRLDFESQVVVNPPQPILISGSVPYKLPFAKVQPDSDRISLDVNVQNEGLALLNLLTREQVRWVSGVGQAQLQVRGTLDRPVPTGIVTVQNATINAQVLPEPLNNVTGEIQFERDRIRVENLAGNLNKGQIVAQGTIPILTPLSLQDPDRANPLTVSLNQARVNLKELYRGGVDGNVTIAGTVVNPQISGELLLANGQVFLPQTSANTGGQQRSATPGSPIVEFRNFQLVLGEDVNITQQPLLSFEGTGNLTINGFLDAPRPEGTIELERGRVNVFAAVFRLDRSYENTAIFVPDQGFDPNLNVTLVTSVPEVTSSRLPASPYASEINDAPATGYGSLQSIRVQARVEGRASQLEENLELTSNPPRSESEIVALIGGGFVNSLGVGDNSLAGLASVAGSVLLPGLEGIFGDIAETIGLSEFRIFPTVVTSEKETSSSVLGLAAEIGVDVTKNFSVSLLRVLTAEQPTQFNLRYRLSNEFLLRGSTDFSGDTRGAIEFQRRF